MKRFLYAGAVAITMLWAAGPDGFHIWTKAEIGGYAKTLAPKMSPQKIASEPLGKFGNHSIQVTHREASGEAELHLKQTDVMVIESGAATLLVGGTIPDSRTSAPNEVRGPKVVGGESKKLGPGDVVHIPPGVPHQMLLDPGVQITYAVVKIDAP